MRDWTETGVWPALHELLPVAALRSASLTGRTHVLYGAGVINTPYTRWQGDQIHGTHPVVTPVWVRLDALYPRAPDAQHQVVPDGLDLVGEVPGMLSGWFRSVQGDWLAVLSTVQIPYADGRRHQVRLIDQLVPGYCVRRRDAGPDDRPARTP